MNEKGRKEGRNKERKEGRKKERKEGRKEGRREGSFLFNEALKNFFFTVIRHLTL